MKQPRFEGPEDVDRMALRFLRTRLFRAEGLTLKRFLEDPERFEERHRLKCRSWKQNPLIHTAQCGHSKPIYLN